MAASGNTRHIIVLAGILILSGIFLFNAELGGSSESSGRFAVITEYFGVTSEEIEDTITIPMEEAVSSISGIRELRCMSEFSKSRIDLRLSEYTDETEFLIQLREQVDRVYSMLKQNAPAVQKPPDFRLKYGPEARFLRSLS